MLQDLTSWTLSGWRAAVQHMIWQMFIISCFKPLNIKWHNHPWDSELLLSQTSRTHSHHRQTRSVINKTCSFAASISGTATEHRVCVSKYWMSSWITAHFSCLMMQHFTDRQARKKIAGSFICQLAKNDLIIKNTI